MKFKPLYFLFYPIGGFFIALGANFMVHSKVGSSTWDGLHVSLAALLNIEFGTATIVLASFITVIVMILNKNIKYILMFPPIFYVGFLIIFLEHVLMSQLVVTNLFAGVLMYLAGLLILPFGGSLLIISTLPAGIFDELTLTLMRLFKTNNIVRVRVIMELTAVVLAISIGFISGIGFGAIQVGTIIFSLSVGKILKTYLLYFERMNLYEIEQTN